MTLVSNLCAAQRPGLNCFDRGYTNVTLQIVGRFFIAPYHAYPAKPSSPNFILQI